MESQCLELPKAPITILRLAHQFKEIIDGVLEKFKDIPNYTCQMACKFLKTIRTCLTAFEEVLHQHTQLSKFNDRETELAFGLETRPLRDQNFCLLIS